jgi:endoglucanase
MTGARRYRDGVLRGLDCLFGRNPVGLSFVTGWGTETAHRQRVRHFAHTLDPSFPPPPRGSVAGGPASKDFPGFPGDPRFAGLPDQLHYVDEPTSETSNDVCIRWNAPLVLLAAYLGSLVQAA